MKRLLPGLAVLATSILMLLACQNPASTDRKADSGSRGGRISVRLTGLSPIFGELFATVDATGTRSVSSRALIGASRAEFRLYNAADAEVDSWTWTTFDMNDSSGWDNGALYPQSHSVPASVISSEGPFRLEADIYNEAVPTTTEPEPTYDPVVSGSAGGLMIAVDEDTRVTIRCVPVDPADLVFGSWESLQLPPFVLLGRNVTEMGGEAWYKIQTAGPRLILECAVDAENTSTVAGVLYDDAGSVASGQVKFSATAAEPFRKIFSIPAGTYYLGVAQSRPLGAGSDYGFSVRAVEGPFDPAAPTLTPGPGTVTVTWQSDPSAGTYTIFYGQPLSWDTSRYQGGILKLTDIPAIDGEISRTIELPPEETYGFWLEWSKEGITATGQIVWDQYAHGTSGVGYPATARALHSVATVNTDWTCEAIGSIPDGSASYDAGAASYTVTGAGVLGLGASTDGGIRPTWLQFLHRPISGDFTMQVRVVSIGDNGATGEWRSFAQAGIALRSDLTPESVELLHGVEFGAYYTGSGTPTVWTPVPQQSVSLTYPQTGEGGNAPISVYAVPVPVWLKVTRVGNLVESWYSNDDRSTWIEVNPYGGYNPDTYESIWLDMNLSGAAELGMYVIGNNWDVQATAVFDNVTITTP